MSLESLFSPRAIAVIGASTKPGSVGNSLTENLTKNGYSGNIYPVNPKAETLFGLPCFQNITHTPNDVDLVIIIVPRESVPTVLRESGEKGVRAAAIISSGFKETGEKGRLLEEEIVAISKQYGITLLGPNCLGFLRPHLGLNASFAKRMPKDGTIAFFSQSGALCTALLDLTAETLGFSHFISTGNKTVIDENALLEFLGSDSNVRLVGFYTEGLLDAPKLIQTGRTFLALPDAKPVVALKSGATEAGTAASSSHTGALAGSDAAYRALFWQARMLRADSLEQLLDFLVTLSHNPLPEDNRIAIITNAGGLGVLATDAAITSGLTLAPFTQETSEALRTALPEAASSKNPIDILGDARADRYQIAINAAAADPNTDMLLVIVTPQTMTEAKETAQAIIDAKNHFQKPIIAVFSGEASLANGIELLQRHSVATLCYPENAARALGSLAQITKWRKNQHQTPFSFNDIDTAKVTAIFSRVRAEGRTTLSETEASDVLKAYGFPFLTMHTVHDSQNAKMVAQSIGKPVALKIVSPDITHKSDVGGVLLNILPENADEAYETLIETVKSHIPNARIEGVLVVEMADSGGREIILGMKHEPALGALLMIGLGGIYVETFKDVSFRFAPLSREDALEMLFELKSSALLKGVRGQHGIDFSALTEYIGRLSRLVLDFPDIEELDINPLLTFPNAASFRVLDARMRLKK